MAYPKISNAAADKLVKKYKDLKDDLPNQTGNALGPHKAQMESVGTKAEEALNQNIRTLAGYFAQHQQKVNKLHADATSELKFAKDAAAKYKKQPESSVAAALQRHIQQLKSFHDQYTQDATDYGASSTEVRPYNPTGQIDKKYTTTFSLERSKLINGQQALLLKGNQLKAMHQEGKAQLAIVTKAMAKKGVQHAGLVRPQALTAATDLATKLSKMLADLKVPTGMTPKPASIATGLLSLRGMATNDTLLQDMNDLEQARGAWKTTETAYKSMLTKKKAMEALLTSQTKGLRSTEKADPAIKQKLKDAAQSVKAAQTEIKSKDKDYAESKKFIGLIEAKAKKKKIA